MDAAMQAGMQALRSRAVGHRLRRQRTSWEWASSRRPNCPTSASVESAGASQAHAWTQYLHRSCIPQATGHRPQANCMRVRISGAWAVGWWWYVCLFVGSHAFCPVQELWDQQSDSRSYVYTTLFVLLLAPCCWVGVCMDGLFTMAVSAGVGGGLLGLDRPCQGSQETSCGRFCEGACPPVLSKTLRLSHPHSEARRLWLSLAWLGASPHCTWVSLPPKFPSTLPKHTHTNNKPPPTVDKPEPCGLSKEASSLDRTNGKDGIRHSRPSWSCLGLSSLSAAHHPRRCRHQPEENANPVFWFPGAALEKGGTWLWCPSSASCRIAAQLLHSTMEGSFACHAVG